MGTSRLRIRRSSAQLHALVQLEREIRASDTHARRKYLREFAEAYQLYTQVITTEEVDRAVLSSDIALVGDYHALPASQRFAAQVVQTVASSQRTVILGLETVFSRDQHILEEWQAGEIDAEELRDRIRFDLDWGYDWAPFYELLSAARKAGALSFGLDCMPRGDLRRIGARDRHAADKIAEIRAAHPEAALVVLFGESHLAPQHLPELLKQRLPREQILTLLQNIDPLYWRAAGEPHDRVEAVRIRQDAICVFNSTPLEKYESYRLCIDRWRCERTGPPDLAPTVYNLVDALLQFLNIDKYAPLPGRGRLFVDVLPEICSRESLEGLRKALQRKRATEKEIADVLLRVENSGCCYVPRMNVVFVQRFELLHGAEATAQFVHAACSSAIGNPPLRLLPQLEEQANDEVTDDAFYARCIEIALGYFGSRVLYPARPSVREQDLYALYARSVEEIEEQSRFSYRDYMQMIDFLVLHKDYESNARKYWQTPALIHEGREYTGERLEFVTKQLGYMLGSELYDAYVSGQVHKRFIRSVFFSNLERPGAAHSLYFAMVRRSRRPRHRWVA